MTDTPCRPSPRLGRPPRHRNERIWKFGARLALVIIGGPSTSALIIVWGPTLILYGLAVKKEGYSIWLGWTGAVVGAAIFALGTIQYLEPNDIFPAALFYGGGTVVSQIWTIVLGVAMWRRAGTKEIMR